MCIRPLLVNLVKIYLNVLIPNQRKVVDSSISIKGCYVRVF